MCLNIWTQKIINFAFGTNGKIDVLSIRILNHLRAIFLAKSGTKQNNNTEYELPVSISWHLKVIEDEYNFLLQTPAHIKIAIGSLNPLSISTGILKAVKMNLIFSRRIRYNKNCNTDPELPVGFN